MAESTVVRTKRDVTISITDGTRTYTVAYEAGDLSIEFPTEQVNLFLDRGAIGTTPSIRKGDDQPMTLSWTAYERDIWSSAEATLLDLAVYPTSSFVVGTWVSTIGTSSDVKTWTINVTVEGSDFGGADKTWSFTYSVLKASRSDGDPNTISISATSYQVRPTVT